MGVLSESLCFCKGVGKTERMKGAVFTSKTAIMARVSGAGTGFLIHRNLLLTTHSSIPSIAAAESSEIQLHNMASAILHPHRFFITSPVLDLTIVGLDYNRGGDSNSQNQPPHPLHFLKTCQKASLDLGSIVYILGYNSKKELCIEDGKVVIATDNLIKLSTDGVLWSPGSAGFDSAGNLAFIVCDPMKLAASPNTKSSSTSSSSTSSSSKRDLGTQFGIPIPIIYDWMNQHQEGFLDEPSDKVKLPIIGLMSTGARMERASSSFTLHRVFKSKEADDGDGGTQCWSNPLQQGSELAATSCSVPPNASNWMTKNNTCCPSRTRLLSITTPEMHETPEVNLVPISRKGCNPIQLLDTNPLLDTKAPVPLQLPKLLIPDRDENSVKEVQHSQSRFQRKEEQMEKTETINCYAASVVSSSGSVNVAQSMVHSCASPSEASGMNAGYSSEEETMYSAETAESRNYTSPKEGKLQQVGRSQSCVSYGRWAPPGSSNATARRALLEKQRSFIYGRKVHSQGASSHRSNDYYTPTVSSIMKSKNNWEHPHQQSRQRQCAMNSSPRWVF
ncbi:hypothetical protein SAY87_026520 [Trapa incisa]|uniref:Uncharacterized protein n=1 Tax=Trapa incisa TaxID=236973 RepID=A0AAN7GQG0_9MYRT|nr:hypothetical protein SAY87_026520 [Trapa incisa]